MTRFEYEMAIALQQIPEHLGSLLHKARAGQLGIEINHRGLENLETHVELASSRMAFSLVALGLYIAASLLMQHSIGLPATPLPPNAARFLDCGTLDAYYRDDAEGVIQPVGKFADQQSWTLREAHHSGHAADAIAAFAKAKKPELPRLIKLPRGHSCRVTAQRKITA